MGKITNYLKIYGLLLIIFLSNSCIEPRLNYDLAPGSIRVATYNASLFRMTSGELIKDLTASENNQIGTIAEVIQRIRPDIIVLNEFDFDVNQEALNLFSKNYLEKNQNGIKTIHYPFRMAFPSNTGIPSGIDYNNDGKLNQANDAYGYGTHPGQYGFVIFSRYPFVQEDIRTFQKFLWKDMPNAALPLDKDGNSFLTEEALDVFRLSSKNHVDVPLIINDKVVHALISHPTPPVFDGPEDLNGKRNHDEIRFWADYLNDATYIYDDKEIYGGLKENESFIIFGDLNADPIDGDSFDGAINQLLNHTKINKDIATGNQIPLSEGSMEYYLGKDKEKQNRSGNIDFHTSVFGLRIDYILPSNDLSASGTGVFWPPSDEDFYHLTYDSFPSDHRLVWVDIKAVF